MKTQHSSRPQVLKTSIFFIACVSLTILGTLRFQIAQCPTSHLYVRKCQDLFLFLKLSHIPTYIWGIFSFSIYQSMNTKTNILSTSNKPEGNNSA